MHVLVNNFICHLAIYIYINYIEHNFQHTYQYYVHVVWPHVIINYDSQTRKMFHAENGYSLIITLQHV